MALFQCQLCSSSCNEKGVLLSHLKECSETQMKILFEANQCLQCRNAFLSRELLLVHINTCSMEQLESLRQMELVNKMTRMRDSSNTFGINNANLNPGKDYYDGNPAAPSIKQEDNDSNADKNMSKKEVGIERDDNAAHPNDDNESNYSKHSASSNNSAMREGKHENNIYNCPSCDKSFSSTNLLQSHNDTIHLGKVGNQCNLCGKKFNTAQHIRQHDEAVHQGLKSFKRFTCNLCAKTFSRTFNLRSHDEEVHKRIRHQCTLCGKSYARKFELNTHTKLLHAKPDDADTMA